MEENLIIDISESNKGKEQIIINKKYKFNFSYKRKDNSKKEILKYNSSHNHPENEYDVSLSIMKHKIKDGIEKSSIPFVIKIKPLYNKISKEMELIRPEYNSIKSQISRNLNKKLPSNVTTFAEIPSESEYFIPQWYFIKENNEEERVKEHQQVVVFSPDEFEAIKDVEGSSLLFYKAFKHSCPKYRGKSTGYDDLRDFNNEIQIINAFESFVSKKEETKTWYKKEKKEILNKLRDNPRLKGVLMWYEFNQIISKFEYKFCEFTQTEQEYFWNHIKPINKLTTTNLKNLIKQIEKVSYNLNKEYENMCRLPITNKSVDITTRNNINKIIYKDTLKVLFTKLQTDEGRNLLNKNFEETFNKTHISPNNRNSSLYSKNSSKRSKNSSKRRNLKINNKDNYGPKQESNNINFNNIIVGNNTEVNNTENSNSKIFISSKPINNPKNVLMF
ncbi:hypothetical protein H8356DRAFT_1337835 [Neocallimastix lanati (nom. inval.)]|nr:hypothetical protein H8356DRAFT_1337835 [Neocallimastix sp. JGI-2020a]